MRARRTPISEEEIAALLAVWTPAASRQEVADAIGVSLQRYDVLLRAAERRGHKLRIKRPPLQDAVLKIVLEHPQAPASEIAERIGSNANLYSVYQAMHQLRLAGLIPPSPNRGRGVDSHSPHLVRIRLTDEEYAALQAAARHLEPMERTVLRLLHEALARPTSPE